MGLRAEARLMDMTDRLRSAKLRPTRQRHALARLLFAGGDRHVTAEQLHGEALAADVRVSLATVYNTLHHFTRAGLLRELVVESGRAYFDTNTTYHHHFFDEESGELTDISGDDIRVSRVPRPPAGSAVSRVDVVVRLRRGDAEDIV
jgi:Fur family iron response transcriptional regulator